MKDGADGQNRFLQVLEGQLAVEIPLPHLPVKRLRGGSPYQGLRAKLSFLAAEAGGLLKV